MPKPKMRTIKVIGKNGEQVTVPLPETDNPEEIKKYLQDFLKNQAANETKK